MQLRLVYSFSVVCMNVCLRLRTHDEYTVCPMVAWWWLFNAMCGLYESMCVYQHCGVAVVVMVRVEVVGSIKFSP